MSVKTGTIGRGTTVHALSGDYAMCGKGSGRNAISETNTAITCKSAQCQAEIVTEIAAPAAERYLVTYRVNSLARGWVTKKVIFKGSPERVTAKIAAMMSTSGYRVLSSEKI